MTETATKTNPLLPVWLNTVRTGLRASCFRLQASDFSSQEIKLFQSESINNETDLLF